MTEEQKNAIRYGVIGVVYNNTDDNDKSYFNGLIYALETIISELNYLGGEEEK